MNHIATALALSFMCGCTSQSTREQQVFDCHLTGQTATCLQMRYGWSERDAARSATDMRVRELVEQSELRRRRDSAGVVKQWKRADSLGTSCYYPDCQGNK